ncbi:MAG: hypothetical protein AAF399_01805 [Bacteroidota bacterium]
MADERDIRGLLQEQFDGYEAEPDRDLWASIEEGLQLKEKKRALWINWVAIAASISLLIGLIFYFQGGTVEQSNRIAEQPGNDDLPAVVTPAPTQVQAPKQLAEESANEETQQANERRAASPNDTQPLFAQPSPNTPSITQPENQQEETPALAETRRTPLIDRAAIKPLRNVDEVVRWEESLIGSADPIVMDSPLPEGNQPNLSQRPNSQSKNELNLEKLTLRDALAFASRELSKVSRSPVAVKEEQGENEQLTRYQLKVLNLKFASEQQEIKPIASDAPNIEAEDVVAEETVNAYQFDFFNLKIRKKTHKRVVNSQKS